MTREPRIIRLEGERPEGVRRFLSDRIALAEGRRTVVIDVTRVGKFYDPRYGEFEITREMLLSMQRNFEERVYGQDIALDVAHRPQDGAAGYFRRLFLEGNKLRGEIELTDYGIDAVSKRGFKYVSPEYHENFVDNEKRLAHGPTLLGAGLTIRPVVKHQDPVQLSEDCLDKVPTLLSDKLKRILSEEIEAMNKYLEKLRKFLTETLKLGEDAVKQLGEAFAAAAKAVADDDAALQLLYGHFEATGKQLAEAVKAAGAQGGDKTIKLDFSGLEAALKAAGAGAKTLSEDDVRKLLEEQETKRQAEAKKLAETRAAKVKIFTDALEAAEGLKGLSESARKELGEAQELITAEMTDEQVRKLAENQIKIGNQIAAQAQLAAMGWAPGGSARITLDESNKTKELQEAVDKRLGLAGLSESQRFAKTDGKLLPQNKALADKVLAEFDRKHGAQLAAEHKLLAGGDGIVSDVAVPAIYERTVIREALYQLIGLQFVDSDTIQFASSALIPYSFRDTAAAGRNSTRHYEGQGIRRAGVKQESDTAYPIPQKIAFEVSDELRYLTASGIINWDAVIENQRNASRIIGEDTEQLIFNEVLHAADEFGAEAVANENLELQADGAKRVFVLANFPVVRPRKLFDLQGNQIGNTINPVTVTYNAVELEEYDGTGTQQAGTYYVLNYNLGEIYLVNEAGAIQTPADATAYTISYSYATNVNKFDSDLPADTKTKEHWDTFLYRYGLRKSEIEDVRFHAANFGLMSGTLMNAIEQAETFAANFKRPGTDLMADGNLGRIKNVPNFKTSAPSLWMGDQRVIIGERNVTRFRMMKPWAMGQLENQKDANGRFTGKKEAYGDQFIVLHTPTPLKRALTSILVYSATARVARANP